MSICFLQLLWNYKLNLTTDPKFESVAVEVCKSTISEVGLHHLAPVTAAYSSCHRQWNCSTGFSGGSTWPWNFLYVSSVPPMARLKNALPRSWARATWCPAWWTTAATSATTTASSTSPRWPASSSATSASSAASRTAAARTSTRCTAAASAWGRRWDAASEEHPHPTLTQLLNTTTHGTNQVDLSSVKSLRGL